MKPSLWSRLTNRAVGVVQSFVGSARAVLLSAQIRAANVWREGYNPLRSLTIARAVTLVETWDRGEFADLMWVYRWIERSDPTLSAVLNRREAALTKLDWEVKLLDADELAELGATEAQAKAQHAALKAAYSQIDNLREAFAHLGLADFRGFSHLEKQRLNGSAEINHLEPIDHWNVLRQGLRGDWYYNPSGMQRSATSLADADRLDPLNLITLTTERHVDFVALFCVLRKALGQKNWAAFVEAFGLNATIIIGPPGVQDETKEKEFRAGAEAVAESASGYLPNGSTVHYANSEKGAQPFKDYIAAQDADIVLAGTSGKLTMLTESGSGTLAGGAHSDTFDELAQGNAQRISEAFQRDFDLPLLTAAFPGQPVLAYFELCANEETDTGEIVKDVAALATAGYLVSAEQITEKTGYEVEVKEVGSAKPEVGSGNPQARPSSDFRLPASDLVPNRQSAIANRNSDEAELASALAADLAPVRERLTKIAELTDPDSQRLALRGLLAELPELTVELLRDPAAAEAFAQVLGQSLADGLRGEANPKPPTA